MTGFNPRGAVARGSLDDGVPGLPPAYTLAQDSGPRFLAVEVDLYLPGAGETTPLGEPRGGVARGALTPMPAPVADFTTLRASDHGYVTRQTDPAGLQPYAPILAGGIEIDRAMDLAPDGTGAAAGWGTLRLIDAAGSLTPIATTRNADGRGVRVRIGRKQLLPHGVWRDPAWVETAELLNGIASGIVLEERELRIGLRDPGYWLERQADGAVFTGAGGLEGSAALSGKRKPRVRGGTGAAPVREVAPTLVDASAGIYQVSDARGTVVALYERGLAGGITSAGTVADITVASPSAGTYVVESSARGLFVRLGTFPPAGTITVDATGEFPTATAERPSGLAYQTMIADLGVPSDLIDVGSFTGLSAAFDFPAGYALGAGEVVDGARLVGLALRSAGARLVPSRNGKLRAVQLRAVAAGTVPVATYTTAEIIACTPIPLGPPMDPPPYRARVGWGRNHTIQTSALEPTLPGARIQELAEPYRIAAASNAEVLSAWRRPSDGDPVETMLTSAAGGLALAELLRDLWCVPAGRRLWAVTLPLAYALRHDVGEPIVVAYPGPLAAGAIGRIVGEQLRTADDLATLQVLI